MITVDEKDNASKELIINGKNGLVCKLDEKELAENIEFLLKNNFYKKLEKNCLDISRNYDNNVLIDRIEEVYRNAL